MLTFVWSQIRHRAGRSAILALGVALAAASVVVLTGAARTSQVQVTGTVEANFRSAYDIVVRPTGTKTSLESKRGLVQGNYLSGIYGGISMRQYHQIAELPGVEVAAPVANLGYLLVPQRVVVDLDNVLTDDPVQIFRITSSVSADGGLSRYPGETAYVYFTRQHRFVQDKPYNAPQEVVNGKRLDVCDTFWRHPDYPKGQPIFHPEQKWGMTCFSARTPDVRRHEFLQDAVPPGTVGNALSFVFPVQVAAIDPVAEQRLVALAEATTSGRPLTAKDEVRWVESKGKWPTAPVIASTRTFVHDSLDIRIERLELPPAQRVPRLMAAKQEAYPFLTSAESEPVSTQTVTAESIWPDFLKDYRREPQFIHDYYSAKPVTYVPRGEDLRVLPVTGNRKLYQERPSGGSVNYVPVDSADTQVRKVVRHLATNFIADTVDSDGIAKLQVVGTYDPQLLRGFSALSEVPLTSYRPPDVRIRYGAGDVTGQRLWPDRNLGGYITQPPVLLTTLKGMDAFSQSRWPTSPQFGSHQLISSIRVRVADVTGIDAASQARIQRVALGIHRSTGLDVDVTMGSSPAPQTVHLPAGQYGRPALTVEEYWVKKGVAVTILEAVDRKSAALLGLMGLVCALFVANGATAAMRARRPQFGVLACLGWSSGRLFGAAVAELVALGVVGGLVGLGAAVLAADALDVALLPAVVAWVIPGTVALSALAGMFAAARAARVTPADAVRPSAAGAHRARGGVRGVLGLALRGLARVPGRTAVSALALAITVAALTVLLAVTLAFKGTVAGSLLGAAVIFEVSAADYLAVAVTALLGAAVVGETLSLEVRERAPELAALSATGWRDSRLARLLGYEGIGIGLLGSVVGAAVGFGTAQLLGTPVGPLAAAALLAAVAGVAVAAAACVGPTLALRRMSVPQLLAEE